MKKVILFSSVLLAFLFTACQSSKVSEKTSEKGIERELEAPDFSRNGGKKLDGYWDSYFETKDTFYLDQIMIYADSEDLLLENLNKAYSNGSIDDGIVEYLSLKNKNGVLSSDYDMDAISVVLMKNGDEDISSDIKYIYSLFPQELLVRNAIKTSAYWSLSSNAEQHDDVNSYLKNKLKDIKPEARKVFEDIYDIK